MLGNVANEPTPKQGCGDTSPSHVELVWCAGLYREGPTRAISSYGHFVGRARTMVSSCAGTLAEKHSRWAAPLPTGLDALIHASVLNDSDAPVARRKPLHDRVRVSSTHRPDST